MRRMAFPAATQTKNVTLYMKKEITYWTLRIKAQDADTGVALPGVKIYLNGTYKGTTDTSGYFSIYDLTAGTYTIRGEKSGYQPAETTVTLT